MSALPAIVDKSSAASSSGDGLSHQDFMAISGLAPLPPLPVNTKPLPMEYGAAVRAIAACKAIDEAKYWDNRADALAAWAKIYMDDQVSREARSLKLHAYRRMGQLAEQLRPGGFKGSGGYAQARGSSPGARDLLIASGCSSTRARQIRQIAGMPEIEFQAVANSNRPPSPSTLAEVHLRRNPEWAAFSNRMSIFLSVARKTNMETLVDSMNEKERIAARRACVEVGARLREFESELHRRLSE